MATAQVKVRFQQISILPFNDIRRGPVPLSGTIMKLHLKVIGFPYKSPRTLWVFCCFAVSFGRKAGDIMSDQKGPRPSKLAMRKLGKLAVC